MGLDLYIEARICEKKTGRYISSADEPSYAYEQEDKGFFEICWWCSWDFLDIRKGMIAICNKYTGTAYTDSDDVIPVPQTALREIYAYLVSRAYLPPDEKPFEVYSGDIEWLDRCCYEKMNLVNADKLHDLLAILLDIQYNNTAYIDKKWISDKKDFKLFWENPQAYAWEFRIVNSY